MKKRNGDVGRFQIDESQRKKVIQTYVKKCEIDLLGKDEIKKEFGKTIARMLQRKNKLLAEM